MLLKEKNEIIEWLERYRVKNYTLRSDETYGYIVDVAGEVSLGLKRFTEIRVKFGVVSGNFLCHNNQLTSLIGCPDSVGGGFYCAINQLTSLEGCPHTVGGDFSCRENQLTSLDGSAQNVGGSFSCNDNQLSSLEGMPHMVSGFFSCYDNPDLGELQDITDFNEIKAYLLAEKLANELNMKDNKRKVKL